MVFTTARVERDVDDAPSKIDKHIIALFPVRVAHVLASERKSTIEHLSKVRKIIEVLYSIKFPLVIIPGTRRILAHNCKIYIVM